jgi:hypothetical protein
MKLAGLSFLLTGSGIYWILSSQLIGSFTVLAPNIFDPSSYGNMVILFLGILCTGIGLGTINNDVDKIFVLLNQRPDGWIFTLPICLASLDIIISMIGITTGQVRELNPLISMAIGIGPYGIAVFFVSYLALSTGLSVLMLDIGAKFFGPENITQYIGFAMVCGIASFGPFANIWLLTTGSTFGLYLLGGAILAAVLSTSTFYHFKHYKSSIV